MFSWAFVFRAYKTISFMYNYSEQDRHKGQYHNWWKWASELVSGFYNSFEHKFRSFFESLKVGSWIFVSLCKKRPDRVINLVLKQSFTILVFCVVFGCKATQLTTTKTEYISAKTNFWNKKICSKPFTLALQKLLTFVTQRGGTPKYHNFCLSCQ